MDVQIFTRVICYQIIKLSIMNVYIKAKVLFKFVLKAKKVRYLQCTWLVKMNTINLDYLEHTPVQQNGAKDIHL